MAKSKVVRIQLAVLAVLTLLVIGRVVIGPGTPDGLLVVADLEPGELRHVSFKLENTEPFLLEATGSLEVKFDPSRPVPALAAYPWILNRTTREVVWKMEPANVQVERTTVARAATTLSLGPGTYDVFFTTYGNTKASRRSGNLLNLLLGTHWTADRDKWRFALRPAASDGVSGLEEVSGSDEALAPDGASLIWTAAPITSKSKKHFIFKLDAPGALRVYALGEICEREQCDSGWVEEVFSGERVWEFRVDNSSPAGGMVENRVLNDQIQLPAGTFRAVFKTDYGHAYGKWIANPPFDPAAWGMSLFSTESSPAVVAGMDPWSSMSPAIQISKVGNDERRQVRFEVEGQADVVLHATGELMGSGGLYDCGWLRSDDTGERVWEMSWANSYPAGGADKNRQEYAFLRLPAGSYSLFYETDDSHAFDAWNSPQPSHPDRWGVALFVVGGSEGIRVIETAAPCCDKGSPDIAPADLPPLGTGRVLVDARRVANDSDVKRPFRVAQGKRVRVVAVGEISLSGRYDYGWIEDAGGSTVWEMTYSNTMPAGGEDTNRRFDGFVQLPAGSYVVRFVTDFSHAFGDFGDEAPDQADSWGIYVEELPG